jgi:hypothetical protein
MPDPTGSIIELVHRRAEKYQTLIEPCLPPLPWINEPCYVGVYSIATDATKRRFLREDSLISLDHSQ